MMYDSQSNENMFKCNLELDKQKKYKIYIYT